MVIAINTRYFLKTYQQDYSDFIHECFSRITKKYPQHTFIFLSDFSLNISDDCVPFAEWQSRNITDKAGLWYKLKIAALLKKYKADVFVNADGFCLLFTKVPQCFIMPGAGCLYNKYFIKKNHLFLYKKFLSLFLKNTKVVITGSRFSKNCIKRQYSITEQKIDIIPNGISTSLAPIDWKVKEKIKAQYADGNEYFIFCGSTSQQNNFLSLLKAFSQFKKWQKSNMQLLIMNQDTLPEDLTESLKSFKYRKDVKVLNLQNNELTKAIAASYCMLYVTMDDGFQTSVLTALTCSLPVITNDTNAMPELFSDAVLYTDFNNPADLAEKFMLIFKDEKLRKGLIEKGRQKAQEYNWEKISELVWQSILKAAS
ncbi:MAG: glycosyltransferase [Ginsengibacter sp.]